MTPRPRVTVTTVLYNSAETLPRYCATIAPAIRDGVVTIFLVDNASPDASAYLARTLLPEATILRNSTNHGFAAGCNTAWPHVASPYWLLLNPDVEIQPGAITALANWMDEHPRVAAVSPRLVTDSGAAINVARPPDTLWRPLAELFRMHKLIPKSARAFLLLAGGDSAPPEFRGWLPGAAMMVRASGVHDFGLLDETLFMYGEDREWCARMIASAWRVGICGDVTARHTGGSSASTTWGDDARIHREVDGHLRVLCRLRSRRYARTLAAVLSLQLLSIASDPRNRGFDRRALRARSSAYFSGCLRLPDSSGQS